MKNTIKLVKTQSKGMVTIPTEFRKKLGIDENSLLQARIVKNGVFFIKMNYQNSEKTLVSSPVEIYSDRKIKGWILADKLDSKTAAKLKKILG